MTLDAALRLVSLALAATLAVHGLEHLRPAARPAERWRFALRTILCAAFAGEVATGVPPAVPALLATLLVACQVAVLRFFNGPYNGGADRMGTLILVCLALSWAGAAAAPGTALAAYPCGYLALQLVLSYWVSGWVKVVNPAWRSGRALVDVFAFSAYPVSERLCGWARRPRLLLAMGWAVMLFELAFPLALLNRPTLLAALAIAALFHGANACLFGLNRFFWTWLCAYPALIWFQQQVFAAF